MDITRNFTDFASHISRVAGRPAAFVVCMASVVAWAVTGPLFGFSDTWQLVINTSTTIVTFLMVFLIQNTQNRDNAAVQAKLDELIRASNAHNRYIGIEKLTDAELEGLLDELEQHAARTQSSEATGKRVDSIRQASAKRRPTTRRRKKAA
jgi:low affinity Fe/Cu permease